MGRRAGYRNGLPRLGRDVLALLAAGIALSVLVAWIASSYFAVDVAGSLIWPGADGYCDASDEAVGVHCFSDLAQFLTLGASVDPETSNPFIRNYPPLNRLGFFVFQWIAVGTTQLIAVVIYVALSALCLLVPALWVVRQRTWQEKLVIVSIIGVVTFPFLATLDRGNNIAFAVPLVFVFILALQRQRYALAIVAIVIGSQIKPQIGLLAVGFLVVRRYRDFLIAVVASVGVFLASFAIFWVVPGGLSPLQEFKDFILYTQFYDQYLPLTQTYPLNISFVHLLGLLWEGIGFGAASTEVLQWVVYGVVAAAILAIVWRGASLGIAVWFPAVLMGVFLVPNPVFAYYLVGASIVVVFFFRRPFMRQIAVAPRLVRGLLVAAVVTSLVPLLIPAGWAEAPVPVMGEGVVVSVLPRIASVLWFAYLIAVAFSAVRNSRESVVIHEDVMES